MVNSFSHKLFRNGMVLQEEDKHASEVVPGAPEQAGGIGEVLSHSLRREVNSSQEGLSSLADHSFFHVIQSS